MSSSPMPSDNRVNASSSTCESAALAIEEMVRQAVAHDVEARIQEQLALEDVPRVHSGE